ncbi:MAG: methyl-accepting chemotaxis protein [Chloroflexota bacterium]
MNWLNNLKTSVKLLLGFGLIIVLLLATAGVAIFSLQQVADKSSEMYNDRTLPIVWVGEAEYRLYKLRGDLYKYLLIPEERTATRQAIVEDQQVIQEYMDKYRNTYLVAEEEQALAEFDRAYAEYIAAVNQAISNVESGNFEAAQTAVNDGGAVAEARKKVGASMDKITEINNRVAGELNQAAESLAASMRLLLIGVAALGLVLAVAAAFLITRSITLPLGLVTTAVSLIAEGDLLRSFNEADRDKIRRRRDEFGTLGNSMDKMVDYLQETAAVAGAIADNDLTVHIEPRSERDELRQAFVRMVQSLRQSLEEVRQAAVSLGAASTQMAQAADQAGQATNQIAVTIQQVSRGINQEAESVTRTSQSVEQMSRAIDGVAKGAQEQAQAAQKASVVTAQINQAIQQVAQNAQSVTKEAANASAAATDGVNKVKSTLDGMQAIRQKVGLSAQKVQEMGKRSEQITVIVEAIEDIASQTNLLALNAAIEAARAGEHGKGFAVVADEVRKLAERASASTREIGELIKGIQQTVAEAVSAMQEGSQEVEKGVTQAGEAGAALQSILQSSQAVSQQAEQAAAAAEQMSASAAELVAAVDAVMAVVEENTAATEQMAAGANEVTGAIENIASVSEENSAAVEEVSASAEEMSAQVEEVAASARSLEEMAQNLKEIVRQFKLQQSARSDLLDEIETFQKAHLKWAERVEKAANGGGTLRLSDVPSHTDCSLGKWYYGLGKREFGAHPEFKAIEADHIHFHELLREFAANQKSGNHGGQIVKEIKQLSQRVVEKLDQLKRVL